MRRCRTWILWLGVFGSSGEARSDQANRCRLLGRSRVASRGTLSLAETQPVRRVGASPADRRCAWQKGNGRGSRSLVELIDLYPTIAELCGPQAPKNIEGQSFVPLLDNPRRKWKKAAFTQVAGPEEVVGRAVRTERYRYIRWTKPYPGEELYDCEKDPREFQNLAQQPSAAKQLAQMRAVLDASWRAAKA